MNPDQIPPLNASVCRRAGALAALGGIAFLVVNAALWLVPAWTDFAARAQGNLQTETITLTPLVRGLGLGLSTVYLAVLARGLWIVRTLFTRLAVGRVFEPETGVLLRRFGKALLLYAALTPIVTALMALLVTMNNPAGERYLKFGVSDHEIVLALVGTLILVIGSVMADAARIADDNRQII